MSQARSFIKESILILSLMRKKRFSNDISFSKEKNLIFFILMGKEIINKEKDTRPLLKL